MPSRNNTHPADPKATTDAGYYAFCSSKSKSGGGHTGPWVGPLRKTKKLAENDIREHENAFPGHLPTLVRY